MNQIARSHYTNQHDLDVINSAPSTIVRHKRACGFDISTQLNWIVVNQFSRVFCEKNHSTRSFLLLVSFLSWKIVQNALYVLRNYYLKLVTCYHFKCIVRWYEAHFYCTFLKNGYLFNCTVSGLVQFTESQTTWLASNWWINIKKKLMKYQLSAVSLNIRELICNKNR